MAQSKPPVSFIGLGAMGFGMAANLVKEGYPVTGFDVWGPTLEKFRQVGGTTATTPASAVADKEFCVCMVATAQQAQAALLDGDQSALKTLPQGAVLLLCSTVPCGYVQGLEKELTDRGRSDIALIDCPVSGGAGRAADGTLSIMAGASDGALERGRHILQAMSDPAKLYFVKGGIGSGSNMKMCHQVLAANLILAASESMGFADHLGLDLPKTGATIAKSEAWSWMFENRLPRMLEPTLPIASAVTIILKDTSIITSEARRAGFPCPMTATAEQVYFTGISKGYGSDDDSSLIRLYNDGKGKIGAVKGVVEGEEAKLALVSNLLRGIQLVSAAEALSFAQRVGLDLDQVFDLCINAAGGSSVLSSVGPTIIKAIRGGTAVLGLPIRDDAAVTQAITQGLQEAVDEAQRLKVPMFLGNEALNIISIALQSAV